jgi:hypothetical protein
MSWKEDIVKTKFEGQEYLINKRIFQTLVIIVGIVGFGIFFYYGGDRSYNLYVSCNDSMSGFCLNPVYQNFKYCGKHVDANSELCTSEYLPNGFVYGSPPPPILGHFVTFTIFGLCVAVLVNHFIHNKKKRDDKNEIVQDNSFE